MQTIKKHKYIILIILLAAFLRLYGISRGDPVNDEALMAFRSIGMIDFDEAAWQTTPFEWFDPLVKFSPTVPEAYRIGTGIPWWAYISWHDHPALVFVVQHIFMSIFGDHVWAFRLPSVLLGTFSVYLIYLIGNLLWTSDTQGDIRRSRHVGLFSAFLYAVTLNSIYISRTGMQEPYVIFFILLILYYLLRAFDLSSEQTKYFLFAGVALGFGTLAKYTVFFVAAPAIFIYVLLCKRKTFYSKKFWLGLVLFLLVVSPIIIYNIELYRTVGHFDFQFSTILRQTHPIWKVQPGKDIGSTMDRIRALVPRIVATHSWLFLSLFSISILGFLFSVFRNGREAIKKYSFLIISFVCIIALLLVIGPSYRFLTMLTPFMALSIGIFIEGSVSTRTREGLRREENEWFWTASKKTKQKLILFWILTGIITFEIFYSWNNQIAYYPVGPEPWLASKVRHENYNGGYNELNDYFENEFKGRVPALTFDLRYQFLNKLRDDALKNGLKKGYQEYPALVVYDSDFIQYGKLWSLDRFHIYHAWPIISLSDYKDYLQKNDANFFNKAGFKNYYFITPAGSTPSSEFSQFAQSARAIEIKNPRGDTAFIVFMIKIW